MLMGSNSIVQILCSREEYFINAIPNAIPPTETSTTKKNALEDLTGCLYYSGADALTASH